MGPKMYASLFSGTSLFVLRPGFFRRVPAFLGSKVSAGELGGTTDRQREQEQMSLLTPQDVAR